MKSLVAYIVVATTLLVSACSHGPTSSTAPTDYYGPFPATMTHHWKRILHSEFVKRENCDIVGTPISQSNPIQYSSGKKETSGWGVAVITIKLSGQFAEISRYFVVIRNGDIIRKTLSGHSITDNPATIQDVKAQLVSI